jgi:hypothetical protein
VRVGIGLGAMEERMIHYAAANVDQLRQDHGLPADPEGDRLRAARHPPLPRPRGRPRLLYGEVSTSSSDVITRSPLTGKNR